MDIAFVELPAFSSVREEHFGGDESFRRLQMWLIANPKFPPVIPGMAGLRKTRWTDASKGIGKRSGLRVIYLYIEEASVIVLFNVYSKNVSVDLTSEQKRAAAKQIQLVREGFVTWKTESNKNE